MARSTVSLALLSLLLALTTAAQAELHWGDFKDNDCAPERAGSRRYSSVLRDIPRGNDWISTCLSTGAPEQAPASGFPDYCEKGWGGVWGNWYVGDSTCVNRPCPPGCQYRSVSCTGALLFCTCWCPTEGKICPIRGWSVCGPCLGVWGSSCEPWK